MEGTVNHASELFEAMAWLFESGWTALTSIQVPGLGISFATLFVGLFLAELGLRFLFMILGISFGHEDVVRGEDSGILKRRDKPGKIGF